MSSAIAVVGAGPRGISIIERIAAISPQKPLRIHIIDDSEIGAGRIWNTAATAQLCMNTLAGAVTLFTEPGSSVKAPVVEGPTMFEWLRSLRGERIENPAKQAVLDEHPPTIPAEFLPEIRVTEPWSNPSRPLYGHYLSWVYRVIKRRLPEHIELVEHNSRAVRIHPGKGHDEITLANGETVRADATVLAIGWQKPAATAAETSLAKTGLKWVGPDNPVEQDLSGIKPGLSVLVRGLGMGFFDVMALLTIGRGGRFVPVDNAGETGEAGGANAVNASEPGDNGAWVRPTPARLRYIPSGEEPRLFVGSGRGYPFLPKSDYQSLPPKAVQRRFRERVAELRDAERIDFTSEVYPALIRDAFEAYYTALAAENPAALNAELSEVIAEIDALNPLELTAFEDALARFVTSDGEAFYLSYWLDPLAGTKLSFAELQQHLQGELANDIDEAIRAIKSPVKQALWALSSARATTGILGARGRYTWESRSGELSEFMAFGQMVGSGPPLFRSQQLLALAEAGIVSFIGAKPEITATPAGYIASSQSLSDEVGAEVLVDAWMHSPDVRRPGDPLAISLGDRVRPWSETTAIGSRVETGSPEVDGETGRLINESGGADPRLHMVGIPLYAQLPDTTISPIPGSDAQLLQETDRVAASVLRQAGVIV